MSLYYFIVRESRNTGCQYSEARAGENSRMTYYLVKLLVSGAIIALASEVARRSPFLGAIIISLPLISILSMIWLWRDTGDMERIASLSTSTFWFVIPTLPMFLVLPWLLRLDLGFWPALGLSCALTSILYLLMVFALGKFGIGF